MASLLIVLLYIKNFSSLLHAAFSNPIRIKEIPSLLEKLEQETPENLHAKKVLFQKLSTYKLVYYINSDSRENLDIILNPIEVKILEIKFNINQKDYV